MERDFLATPERSEPENVHQGNYFHPVFFVFVFESRTKWMTICCVFNICKSVVLTDVPSPLHLNVNQVYDRDLTTDDFMGSASVTLSDLVMDK